VAKKGDRFEMPDGSVYVVETPGAEAAGEFVQMEFILPGGCVAPPPHVHPQQVEEYEVLSGSLEVMVNGEWSTLGPGEKATVPVGALLTMERGSAGRILLGEAKALRRGWTQSVGERMAGIASVSAPVYDSGKVVAAVCVSGPIDRMGNNPGRRLAKPVMKAAEEIQLALAASHQ